MTDTHSQSLSETYARITKVMLVSWRAHGLRSLAELAMHLLIAFQIYAILRELAALLDAFKAGTLPALAPAPIRAPAPQVARPRPAATPRKASVSARAPGRAAIPRPAPPAIARIARPPCRVLAFSAPPRPLPPPLSRVPTPLLQKSWTWATLPSHV